QARSRDSGVAKSRKSVVMGFLALYARFPQSTTTPVCVSRSWIAEPSVLIAALLLCCGVWGCGAGSPWGCAGGLEQQPAFGGIDRVPGGGDGIGGDRDRGDAHPDQLLDE